MIERVDVKQGQYDGDDTDAGFEYTHIMVSNGTETITNDLSAKNTVVKENDLGVCLLDISGLSWDPPQLIKY